MSKKKICYVTTIALTIRAFFIPQLRYLAENGYDVTVVCSPDDELAMELGEKIRYIPVNIARGVSPLTLGRSIRELKEIFAKEHFDIVQYSTPNAAFCASIAANQAGIKIRNYHLMGLRYLGMRGVLRILFKQIEKLTCKLSTNIECITPSNMELSVSDRLFPKDKAVIVWNGSTGGVDMHRFDYKKRSEWRDEIRKELGFEDNDFVFGFVGRITKDKGINELLRAFSELDGSCKLMMVGPIEGINTIDAEIWEDSRNNSNIVIHDTVSDIERYYAAMDVLLLPSYREGFGMVIAEAAAMGTPSIVSDIPGPIDVIEDKKTGFTVKVKDSESLRERMKYFIDHPDIAQKMSEACVNHIKNKFDSDVLCEKILERKEKLLS